MINHSGGKDSQAMTIMLSKILPPSQALIIHAELPGVDWEGIPQHIERNSYGIKTAYTRASKTFFEMVESRFSKRPEVPSFPSPQTRQCTSDLKRGPIDKTVRHYLNAHPEFNRRAVHCIGIRSQESRSRAKAKTWNPYRRESIAGRSIFHWLPIHDLTENEVFSVIKREGQVPHWAYKAGMSRLSCCFCIMSSERDLRTAARLRPSLHQQYIQLEKKTGYTMSMDGKPIESFAQRATA